MKLVKSFLSFRWANTLSELAGYLSAIALVVATFVMLQSVLTRYLFGLPTVWQTEVSIYLLIFVTFFGAAYGLKHHAHVGVDLLVERVPLRRQLVIRIVTSVMALAVVLIVVWTSGLLWYEAYEGGGRSPTALRAPLSVVYAILPLGMILVACQYIAFIIEAVQSMLGHKRPGRAVAILGQGNPELAAAHNIADSEVSDEDPAREIGDARIVTGRSSKGKPN